MSQAPRVLYEDDAVVVIDKPVGWTVHEGVGDTGETVVDWLVKNYPDVAIEPWDDPSRAGIVHRLDKDTSGVMVLAKLRSSRDDIQAQFKDRSVTKEYVAIVYGSPREPVGTIETGFGRHPKRRQEMAVVPVDFKRAKHRLATTDYEVETTWAGQRKGQKVTVSRVRLRPKTGRMHQLRVHCKYLGIPILGDATYHTKPSRAVSKILGLDGQLLHAQKLSFVHPVTHRRVTFEAPLPNRFLEAQKTLEDYLIN